MAEIFGNLWDETLEGSEVSDYIEGGGGSDVVFGKDGDDTLFGDAPNLTNVPNALGNLFLTNLTPSGPLSPLDSGIPGNLLPTIQPLGGNDFISGGKGDDYISGGEGYDTQYEVAGVTSTITDDDTGTTKRSVVTLTNGEIKGGKSLGTDSINDIERVIIEADTSTNVNFKANYNAKSVTMYQVVLLGGNGGDILTGGSNSDILSGSGGRDSLSGGKGVDVLQGGTGRDTIYGGGGEDIFYEYVDGSGTLTLRDRQNVNDPGPGPGDDEDDNIFSDGGYTVVTSSALGQDRLYSVENVYIKGGDGNNLFDATQFFKGNTTLEGGKGDDVLLGGHRLDTILGGIGNDLINGREDDDLLLAGVDNDTVRGGSGLDFIVGDLGNDSLSGDEQSDTLSGGEGNDTIVGSGRLVEVSDDPGSNFGEVTVSPGPDGFIDALREDSDQSYTIGFNPEQNYHTMEGFKPPTIADGEATTTGQDILVDIERLELIGGESRNTIDTAQFAGSSAGAQTVLSGLENRDIIIGGIADDTINGGGDKDELTGGAGDDLLDGFGSNLIGAYLDYPDGTNISGYVPGQNNEVVNNTFAGPLGIINVDFDADTQRDRQDTLRGGDGDDILIGRDRADELDAGRGDDLLMGDDGFDLGSDVQAYLQNPVIVNGVFINGPLSLFGRQSAQPGNDSLSGNEGDDILYGEQGNDFLEGGEDADFLYGGSGNDTLYGLDNFSTPGEDGADNLFGGTGNDSLIGGEDDDSLFGDAGSDTLYGDNRAPGGTSADLVDSDDSLFGGDGADLIYGGAGDDILNEGSVVLAGAVVVAFGPTDPTDGGVGDTLLGGTGDDFLSADDPEDILDAGTGNDTIVAFQGFTTVGNSLAGGDGSDLLIGGVAGDTIDGGIGNDILSGNGGNDSLLGGIGNDTLLGGIGNDSLDGGIGNDSLDGGDGSDTLLGGDGADILNGFDTVADSLVGGNGNDVLSGFANGDTLVGGLGADTITLGGPNGNFVVFNNGAPLTNVTAFGNVDTVNVFVSGLDQLVLSTTTFDKLTVGGSVAYNPVAATTDAFIRGVASGPNTNLLYDPDGNAAGSTPGILFATITGIAPAGINGNDFSVIAP